MPVLETSYHWYICLYSIPKWFGRDFESKFPSALFEVDEAAKCLALSRPTAAVFHLMRSMEIAIHAVRECLAIPAPVKDWERNWGRIIEKIEQAITVRNSANPKNWAIKDDPEFFASIYVSLDAVRVAWRNTTMHVENKYTEEEAEHILGSVRGFMKKLASRIMGDHSLERLLKILRLV